MTLDLLDDVFLLHLALEAPQRILEGLTLLKSDFCQTDNTPKLVPFGPNSYCKVSTLSQVGDVEILYTYFVISAKLDAIWVILRLAAIVQSILLRSAERRKT